MPVVFGAVGMHSAGACFAVPAVFVLPVRILDAFSLPGCLLDPSRDRRKREKEKKNPTGYNSSSGGQSS